MRLPVGKTLVAALDLRRPACELVLGRRDHLLGPRRLGPPLPYLVLDLAPEPDGLLARLDLRLAADRLGLALGDVDARTAPKHQQRRSDACTESESDERRKRREHGVLPPGGEGRLTKAASPRCSHPALGLRGRAPV